MTKSKITWVCTLCGYVHEGDSPPDTCPVYFVGAEYFVRNDDAQDSDAADDRSFDEPLDGPRILIIGGGIAAVSAAEAARNANSRAQITVLCGELMLPYWRVNLTRYLSGEISGEAMETHPEAWYRNHRIDLVLNTEVQAIATANNTVTTRAGDIYSYAQLILANGSHAFMPPMAGKSGRTHHE